MLLPRLKRRYEVFIRTPSSLFNLMLGQRYWPSHEQGRVCFFVPTLEGVRKNRNPEWQRTRSAYCPADTLDGRLAGIAIAPLTPRDVRTINVSSAATRTGLKENAPKVSSAGHPRMPAINRIRFSNHDRIMGFNRCLILFSAFPNFHSQLFLQGVLDRLVIPIGILVSQCTLQRSIREGVSHTFLSCAYPLTGEYIK